MYLNLTPHGLDDPNHYSLTLTWDVFKFGKT